VVSGIELLDDAGTDDSDWFPNGDDEFSGSSGTNMDDASVVTVAFHCYHSLPSAQWCDHVQVSSAICSSNSLLLLVVKLIGLHA